MMYLQFKSQDGIEKLPVTGPLAEALRNIQHCHEMLGYNFPPRQGLHFNHDTRQWTGELKAKYQNDELRIEVIYD